MMRSLVWLIAILTTLAATAAAQTCAPTPSGTGRTFQIPCGASVASWPTSLLPGDNVLFQSGCVYNMSNRYLVNGSGTSSNKILFGAYGTGAKPILDGNLGCTGPGPAGSNCAAAGIPTASHYGFNINGRSDIVIDGLHFRDHGLAVHIENSDRVTVRRSIIEDVRSSCLLAHHGSDDLLVEFNHIANCGLTSNGESIYILTDPVKNEPEDIVWRPVIRYNTLEEPISSSVLHHERVEFKPGTRNGLIEGNLLIGGNQCILVSHWPTSTFQNNHLIRYNLCRNTGGPSSVYGFAVRSGATIHHNVIAHVGGSGRPGIWIHDNQNQNQLIVARHNTVYDASGAAFQDGGGGQTFFEGNNLGWASGSANVSQDPRFVNPAAFDFRLQPGSPASGLGAYGIGDPLRTYGHFICDAAAPQPPDDPPAGVEVVGDYHWNDSLADNSQADNDCSTGGVTFSTPSPSLGTHYATFNAREDKLTCPSRWHNVAEGTIDTLFKLDSCPVAGSTRYLYGESSSTTTFADRKQIYVVGGTSGCQLGLGWGGSHGTAANLAALTPGQWYYLAVTWASGTVRAYLAPTSGSAPVLVGTAGYGGLSAKGATYDWGNNGMPNSNEAFLGGLKFSRVIRRLHSLSELTARFSDLTGGTTTPPGVTVSSGNWRVARADSPQDVNHWMAGLNTPGPVPTPGCVDVRVQVSATGGTFGPTTLFPTWRQGSSGPFDFLEVSTIENLQLGRSLVAPNGTPTANLLGSANFVSGSYLGVVSPPEPFTPITLTNGQTTELVVTACPKDGLAAGTSFELCFAEFSGTSITCTNPARLDVSPGLALFKG